MAKTITFKKKWGDNSWLVDYNGPYENPRPPHVEVSGEIREGFVSTISNPHIVGGKADVYDVDKLRTRGHLAHLTVYFGPNPEKFLRTL